MDAAFASFQARLETYAPPKSKSRRTSTRSKKPAPPKATQKGGWPLAAPRPEDLAFAGFVYKPTSASPDNVQCFSCQTQLDGWEESDTPAYEHLTHSPDCGFAINVCIRLRNGDPGRTEDDPLSENLLEARRMTFANLWPLDEAAGFPGVDKMVNAGWYYDPANDTPDGVTCAYCNLSLDAWDAGDDPIEEHRKRASDCLFFSLKEYYHPTQKPKATRGKRASGRSSTASRTAAKVTKKTKKASARASNVSVVSIASTRSRRNKETAPQTISSPPAFHLISDLTKGEFIASTPRQAYAPPSSPTHHMVSDLIKGEPIASSPRQAYAPPPSPKHHVTSDLTKGEFIASTPKDTPKNQKKRTSEALDVEDALPVPSPKRSRISDLFRSDIIASTPRETPKGAVTTRLQTPTTPQDASMDWDPINIDDFFEKRDLFDIVSSVVVDSGLDKENVSMKETPAVLVESIKARLTAAEKQMTVEEWVLYNARRGEQQLRTECERQIMAFEAQGRRALATLDAH